MYKVKKLIENSHMDEKEALSKMEEALHCYFKEDEEKSKKEEYYDFYWTLYEKIHGKHFNEELVHNAIENMEFAIPELKPSYTKEQIKSYIEQAWKLAEQHYAKKGIAAPKIHEKVTPCDMQYVFNMIAADYPLSHMGDAAKIAMMSYEFLSDPDAPEGKAYLYYYAMMK